MSLWKDNTAPRQTPAPVPEPREPARFDATPKPELVPSPVVAPVPRADTGLPRKESLIAADITIEGKIEGGGSVRIAGKFKGDASVQGDYSNFRSQLPGADFFGNNPGPEPVREMNFGGNPQ